MHHGTQSETSIKVPHTPSLTEAAGPMRPVVPLRAFWPFEANMPHLVSVRTEPKTHINIFSDAVGKVRSQRSNLAQHPTR